MTLDDSFQPLLEGVPGDPESPEKTLGCYYQVRSNITHRGKDAYNDFELLQKCLSELLQIFGEVLQAAKSDAGCLAR